MRDGKIEGCTVDGDCILCVFDDSEYTFNDCDYAKKLNAQGEGRDQCQYWKPDADPDKATDEIYRQGFEACRKAAKDVCAPYTHGQWFMHAIDKLLVTERPKENTK